MPRSGSTLVEQILASHRQVHGAGELKEFGSRCQSRWPIPRADLLRFRNPSPHSTPKACADWGRLIWPVCRASPGKTRITDKTPINFLYVGLIRLILPNARIIHTMRDPVDTCVSCFANFFAGQPFSYDLAELGRHYRWYHELMGPLAIGSAGRRPCSTSPTRRWSATWKQQARRLIDYCGLPWDDRCSEL